MDIIVPTFVRVQRGLADRSRVQALFDKPETSGENVTLSESDRLAVLDFPDLVVLTQSLTSATHLSRQVLLERAASTPDRLTHRKIEVLQNRYWPNVIESEQDLQISAMETIDRPGGYAAGSQ